jgi:hypothetical protein
LALLTEVPLAQMMNPSFYADFVGGHVRTKAQFFSTNNLWGNLQGLDPVLGDPNVRGPVRRP